MAGMRTWSATALGAVSGIGLLAVGGADARSTPSDGVSTATCNIERMQSMAPADTVIVSADVLTEPVLHCKVDGYVTTDNPGPNRVNFRLQLPDASLWKGRYYFIGLGGSAGYVPTDSQTPSGNPMVKGFAVAGTDTGRQGSMLDWSFLSDPAKALDHAHRGAHVTAVATQQLTRAYYQVDHIYRYHTGCSGGGRMGGEAIHHHPEDFDGVLLGQSSVRTTLGNPDIKQAVSMKFIHAAQQMVREPGAWLSPAKLAMVDGKVTAACDETDGALDQVVWDPRLCHYDVAVLECHDGDGPDCLTAPEIRSIKAILDGPRGPRGELLSEPMPISNMSMWSMFLGRNPPPWSPESTADNMAQGAAAYIIATTTGRGFVGPEFDALTFNLADPSSILQWVEGGRRSGDFGHQPDLRPFEATGGKALLWVGMSDPCCSSIGMEGYVRELGETLGDPARVAGFIQMYQIPGMGHCSGGTGPSDAPDQLLNILIDWVESDKIPEGVVMHRGAGAQLAFVDNMGRSEAGVELPKPSGVDREFLVCPFPQVSVFDRSKANVPGAVYDSSNWTCRLSREAS